MIEQKLIKAAGRIDSTCPCHAKDCEHCCGVGYRCCLCCLDENDNRCDCFWVGHAEANYIRRLAESIGCGTCGSGDPKYRVMLFGNRYCPDAFHNA